MKCALSSLEKARRLPHHADAVARPRKQAPKPGYKSLGDGAAPTEEELPRALNGHGSSPHWPT